MAHRGPQHLPERLEGPDFEAGGVEAGEPPVLARGVQRIRRRADGEMAGNRRLLVPGIEAVGLHADRDIEIETDLHAEPPWRDRWHAASCRSAVHCTNSTNSISAPSGPSRRRAHAASSGCRHCSGHSHHGLLNLCRSTSKQANRDNSGPRSARNFSKSCRRPACATGLELSRKRSAARAISARRRRHNRRSRLLSAGRSRRCFRRERRAQIPAVFRRRCRAHSKTAGCSANRGCNRPAGRRTARAAD